MSHQPEKIVPVDSGEKIEVIYESRWHDMPVCLIVKGVAKHCEPHSSLFAAAVLGEAENVCVLMESVLGASLDFDSYRFLNNSSVESSGIVRSVKAKLVLDDNTERLSSREVEICLPADALVDIDLDQLAGIDVLWQPIAGTLRISNIDLSEEDKSRLCQNSLLLIPESFHINWRCALDLSNLNALVDAKFDSSTGEVYTENVQRPAPENRFLQIYADSKISVSPDTLLGRKNTEKFADFDPNQVSRCQCVCADGIVFDAQLLSMGEGFAVCLGESSNGTY